MTLLSAETTRPVSSLRELQDLEHSASGQKAALYDDLARRMAKFGNVPAREAFLRIAQILQDEDGRDAVAGAAAPVVYQDEDLGSSRLVTPYAAFSLAVRNQERGFAFWTYISANSPDADVRSEAERLARRENAQMTLLRAERRQAFHANQPPAVALEALRTATPERMKRRAGEMEGALATLHARIAAALAEVGDARSATMRALATKERENAEQLGLHGAADERLEPLPQDAEALVALATERPEAAVEFYLAAADASRHEEVIIMAQELADRAIRRLSLLL